ncbi:DUF433 domain-containing protein [Anabaena sp. UHCC 0253]|uniref:DUF433 domain-containing protein n=1 Tax=Anabaena sp. UHCC 0253 TaxID=2590019 RepID=UPI00157FDE3A|nr:DUF433 domain-containing protein [Anabaena sp. UHCC 0253]
MISINISLPESINWQEYIHSDPEILLGKPTVKGTRLSVEFLLGLFAAGWSQQQVFDNYPTLTPEGLRAVFAFSADCMREETLYTIPLSNQAS